MRFAKAAVMAFVVILTAAQLIRPEMTNPPVESARSAWEDNRLDPRVKAVLRRACGDCHSHETAWPWYARVSPMSWMVAKHVHEGREKLNFSEWTADADVVEEIYDSVKKDKMPMQGYVLMHPEARLSAGDRELLRAWADGSLAERAGLTR